MNGLLLTAALVTAGAAPENLGEAESAYMAGLAARADSGAARSHFVRAAESYESAWDGGQRTVAIARNMAQSRLLAGDPGRAIRNYWRGLREFSHDRGLRRGLEYSRAQVSFPNVGELAEAARPRDPPSLLQRLPLPVLAVASIAVGCWSLGWLVLARGWVTARGGVALFGGLLTVMALIVGVWLVWENERQRVHWSAPTAIVLAPGSEMRTGNSDEYPRRVEGRLPAGVELRVLGRRGGWMHVELASGIAGWVPESGVVTVD